MTHANRTRGHMSFGWACAGCLTFFANGETNPEWDPEQANEWFARMDDHIGELRVGVGGEHSDDCPNMLNGERVGDTNCSCETLEFSWRSCDVCGSPLGGSRYAVHFWTDDQPKAEPCDCSACDGEWNGLIRCSGCEAHHWGIADGPNGTHMACFGGSACDCEGCPTHDPEPCPCSCHPFQERNGRAMSGCSGCGCEPDANAPVYVRRFDGLGDVFAVVWHGGSTFNVYVNGEECDVFTRYGDDKGNPPTIEQAREFIEEWAMRAYVEGEAR